MSVTRRAAAVLALILAVAVVLSLGAVAGCKKAPASRPTDAGATAGGNEAPASLYARMKVALYRGNAPAAGGWVAWVKTADLHYPDTGPGQ